MQLDSESAKGLEDLLSKVGRSFPDTSQQYTTADAQGNDICT